ncbi:S24 family peptidase [Campylobacter molothri]|uniref:S24 family peptidase n=1 Tax=Campylobacter molothri TaxID=1032242 RepID=A0ACC5W0Y5_9BACT|nr:S24 family peptidase [Campylobacter sp. RM9754]
MVKNVDTKKLQELIYSKFLNYQEFINACSIKGYKPSMSSVKSWFGNNLSGTRSPSIKNLPIIAEVLNVNMEELLTHSSASKSTLSTLKIPIFEMPTGCGAMGEFDPSFAVTKEVDIPKIFIEQKYPDPKHLRIFKCFGDSMQPKYNSGDFVIVDMVNGRNFIKIDGIYVFRFDKAVYIKRLTFMPDKIMAKSINPDYESFEITKKDIKDGLFEILGKPCGRIAFEDGLLLDNQGIY